MPDRRITNNSIGLSRTEIARLVNQYIGVSGGYLGNFTYSSHTAFYPEYCDLDINPDEYEGTTRQRFITILSSRPPRDQAAIVRGILHRFPVEEEGRPSTRTAELRKEFIQIIQRLESGIAVLSEILDSSNVVLHGTANTHLPLEVFCCYAREDQEMLEYLKKHLAPLQRQGLITIWSDTNLDAGVEWEKELHQHLESADIILLLISPDFMASDYCYSTEMGRAIARHNQGSAQVIPILLRATFWQNAPFAKLQMVPTNAKPITGWFDRDDALHDITIQINKVISDLRAKRTQTEADKLVTTGGQQTSGQETPPSSQDFPAASVGSQPTTASLPRSLTAGPEAMALLRTFSNDTGNVWSVALSADGNTLAGGGVDDGTIKLWDVRTGQLLRTLTGHTSSILSVALSADGLTLASGSWDQTINLWNIQTGQLLHTLTGHTREVNSVALSADGLTLASSSWDQTIRLWDVQTGQLLRTLTTNLVLSVALSADGRTLASGNYDPTIKLWNIQTGQLLHTLTGHTYSVNSVALSTDGQTLASGSGSGDQTIKLWNIQTGQLLRTLTGHTGNVWSVAWSADGPTLASGSDDQTIKLWNVQTGQLLRTLTGHTDAVKSVTLSADGQVLASGSDDQTIKVWGVKE